MSRGIVDAEPSEGAKCRCIALAVRSSIMFYEMGQLGAGERRGELITNTIRQWKVDWRSLELFDYPLTQQILFYRRQSGK